MAKPTFPSRWVALPCRPVPPAPPSIDPTAPCPEQVVAYQRRLAAIEADSDTKLHALDRFERGTRSPDTESRIRPFLERVFAHAPDGVTYTAECRGLVCKLDVQDNVGFPWTTILQDEAGWQGLFVRKEFGPEGTFVQFHDEPQPPGKVAIIAVIESFRDSPRIDGCKAQYPSASGEYFVHVAIESERFRVDEIGDLAGTPVGACLRGIIDDVVAKTQVPPGATNPYPDRGLIYRLELP
jgi:hypothetical protein